jgi:hypothetical protein
LAYIGNIPAESYASFETETFSVSATANYTLSHAVTNENEIRLVINGVVQQPGSGKAYTASGTTLTLTSATVSGDVMYAVYLGRALQTVNPPNASVGNSQTAPTIITGQTAETSIATDDTILIHDTSASALRKMTRANFVSGIGGTNTPAFRAYLGSNATPSNTTTTKVNIDTENFDTDNCYDNSSNYRFTPNVAGKYFVYAQLAYSSTVLAMNVKAGTTFIYKNGSELVKNINQPADSSSSNYSNQFTLLASTVVDMNGSSDYLEVYTNETVGTGSSNAPKIGNGDNQSFFGAYKLIT